MVLPYKLCSRTILAICFLRTKTFVHHRAKNDDAVLLPKMRIYPKSEA